MSDHISTEEAERIAESLDFDCKCHRCASSAQQIGADALRALAAERDALREAMETATDCCARATACGRILRDALVENQPCLTTSAPRRPRGSQRGWNV